MEAVGITFISGVFEACCVGNPSRNYTETLTLAKEEN